MAKPKNLHPRLRPEAKNPVGRPILEPDVELIKKLASIHCTMIEIAAMCNCSVDTLENNFSDIIKEAKAKGKASLRRMQYEGAQQGNTTMLVWLGKQLLDQKDVSKIELSQVSDEMFEKEVQRRMLDLDEKGTIPSVSEQKTIIKV